MAELIEVVMKIGKQQAAMDGIPFLLGQQDLIEIIRNQVNENSKYLQLRAIHQYQSLLFGAVACCNRDIATGAVESVSASLAKLNEHRREAEKRLSD